MSDPNSNFCQEWPGLNRFGSLSEAIDHAAHVPGRTQPAVWKCDHCHGWHVTVEAKKTEVAPGPKLEKRCGCTTAVYENGIQRIERCREHGGDPLGSVEVTPGPTLDTRTAGPFVGTKIV